MRRLITVVALVAAALIGFTGTAMAVSATIGNPATDRDSVDTWSNFTIVDTNTSAPFDGYFTTINYYAEQTGTIRFVVVDSSNTMTWLSDPVDVTQAGPGTLNLTSRSALPPAPTSGSTLSAPA